MGFKIENDVLVRYDFDEQEEIVRIPDGIRVIDKYAFYVCSKVRQIFIPDSVVEIGGKSFLNCSNIKRVRIPRGVSHILEFWDNRLEAVTFGGTRAEFARLAQPGWCRSCEVVHCTDGDIPGGYL